MLHWVYTQCPRAKFIIKCDDDVYVNVNNLLSIFHIKNDANYSIKSSNGRNAINDFVSAVYGSGRQGNINIVQRPPGPLRVTLLLLWEKIFVHFKTLLFKITDQKHYISHERWPWPTYPTYLHGKCYLITGSEIASLLAAAITIPFLPFEDLYLTGMCTKKAKVPLFVPSR